MSRDRLIARTGLLLIALSVVLVAIAPLLLGEGYDPVRHSVSESAAQSVSMAWAARTALLLSGLAVLCACVVRGSSWGSIATSAFAAFGLFWMLTSVFSSESWVEGAPFVELEAALHSVFATLMAVIVVGAIALLLGRRPMTLRWRWATVGLVAAATFLPLISMLVPEVGGLSQRVMFLAAYAWFAVELTRALAAPSRPQSVRLPNRHHRATPDGA